MKYRFISSLFSDILNLKINRIETNHRGFCWATYMVESHKHVVDNTQKAKKGGLWKRNT